MKGAVGASSPGRNRCSGALVNSRVRPPPVSKIAWHSMWCPPERTQSRGTMGVKPLPCAWVHLEKACVGFSATKALSRGRWRRKARASGQDAGRLEGWTKRLRRAQHECESLSRGERKQGMNGGKTLCFEPCMQVNWCSHGAQSQRRRSSRGTLAGRRVICGCACGKAAPGRGCRRKRSSTAASTRIASVMAKPASQGQQRIAMGNAKEAQG